MSVEVVGSFVETPEMVVARLKPAVLTTAKTVVADPFEYESHFDERVAVEKALTHSYRSPDTTITWGIQEGFYAAYQDSVQVPLQSVELAMSIQIDELLAKRKPNDKPVIAIDFGGSWGVSMIRIAAAHRDAIEKGNLILGVTNLGYLPSQERDNSGYSGIAAEMNRARKLGKPTLSQAQLNFLQDNQSLVTFIDTNAVELLSQRLAPRGKPAMKLKGAVDIIHESYSVSHSHIPDVALGVFGELLSEQGRVLLHSREREALRRSIIPRVQIGERFVELNDADYTRRRRDSLETGVQLLQQGYKMRKRIEGYSYTLLMKSHLGRPARALRRISL